MGLSPKQGPGAYCAKVWTDLLYLSMGRQPMMHLGVQETHKT